MCVLRIAADSRERIPVRCVATWWGTAVSRIGKGGSAAAGGEGIASARRASAGSLAFPSVTDTYIIFTQALMLHRLGISY